MRANWAVVRFEEGHTDDGAMVPVVLKRFADRDAAQAWCSDRYGEWNEFYGVMCDD